jgi:flavin-binding protein dodecin
MASIVKVIEVMAESEKSWEDAVQTAVRHASETLHGIKSVYVDNFSAKVENDRIVGYRVDAKISFVLEKNTATESTKKRKSWRVARLSVDLGNGALERDVTIAIRPRREVTGTLTLPDDPRGLVIFVHGSGSSRSSARNRLVPGTLVRARFGTLLMDLLTPPEERIDDRTSQFRFDIPLSVERLGAATHAVRSWKETHQLPIGYVGASTGAAAALVTARLSRSWFGR